MSRIKFFIASLEKNRRFIFAINIAFLAAIAVIYFLCLPAYVQGGDTGEMATNPYMGRLLHPPGFPVFYWLSRFITHALPFDSVFTRAAMLSLMASIVSLSMLLSWRTLGTGIAVAAVLAGNKIFWNYSVLPEVFLIQIPLIFVCLVLLEKERLITATIIFILALGVHPQAIFLVPLWLWHVGKRKFIHLSLLSGGLLALVYSTLFLIRSDSVFAWGEIHTIKELIHHVMRFEYGALQLAAGERGFYLFEHLFDFCSKNYPALFVFLPIIALSWKKLTPATKAVFLSTLGFLIIFFSLANANPSYLAKEVVARFHIFPLALIAFTASRAISFMPKLAIPAALIGFAQFTLYFSDNSFANKRVVSEYAANLLRQAESDRCAILITHSDATYVATNYLQSVDGIAPNVLVIAKGLLGLKPYRSKLENLGVKFGGGIDGPKDLDSDVLLANLDRCRIVTEFHNKTPVTGIRFLPVGREVLKTPTVEIGEGPPLVITTRPDDLGHYDIEKRVFARYADHNLMKAQLAQIAGENEAAKAYLVDVLKLVPYCSFAWERLCNLLLEQGLDSKAACDMASLKEPYCDPRRP